MKAMMLSINGLCKEGSQPYQDSLYWARAIAITLGNEGDDSRETSLMIHVNDSEPYTTDNRLVGRI
jgi:hypothetical protein